MKKTYFKESLKIPNRQSYGVILIMTENTIAKRKRTKEQFYKTFPRQL